MSGFRVLVRSLPAALLLALIALAATPLTGHADRPGFDAVCASVQQRASEVEARIGLVVIDLRDGAECSVNAAETFRSASLYKLVVLVEAYQQSANGEFSFDESITLQPRHYQDDPPRAQPAEPAVFSATEALRRMVVFSDNASALALIERLTPDAVEGAPARLGLAGTVVGDRFVTTPADIALLFAGLYRGQLVSPEASAEMLRLLRAQELNDLIPATLPAGVEVAHKTGLIEEYLHDAGIVYAPGGDYVLVILTRWQSSVDQSYLAIHELTALAYGAFETPPAVASVAAPIAAPALDEAAAGALATVARAPAPPGAAATAAVPAAEQPRLAPVTTLGVAQDVPGARWWWPPALLAALALILLAARSRVAAVGIGPGAPPPASAWLARQARYATVGFAPTPAAGRDGRMPFGSRSARREDSGEAPDAAPAEGHAAGEPAASSGRLLRIAEYFESHGELLEQIRLQVDHEVAPLTELLVRQHQTMQSMLEHLEERLRPLYEYADGEQANLEALEERLNGDGAEFVQRSFEEYVSEQRRRIEETRDRIEEERSPFLRYGDDQLEAVEVSLSRFDNEMDALESNLSEQRKVMMRMLDAMRSESFATVRELVSGRETALRAAIQSGVTDPGEISRQLAELASKLRDAAADDSHLADLLNAIDAADERLREAVPSGPRALPPQVPPPAEDDAQQKADAERSSA